MRQGVVTVIGGGAVGKSSIIGRLMGGKHRDKYDPTIEDTYLMNTEYEGEMVQLRFIDTTGQDNFMELVERSIVAANVIVVIYDIERADTFREALQWLTRISEMDNTKNRVPLLLVGNKTDLEGVANYKGSAEAEANRRNAELWWTSAKENIGIGVLRERILSLLPEMSDERSRHCCSIS